MQVALIHPQNIAMGNSNYTLKFNLIRRFRNEPIIENVGLNCPSFSWGILDINASFINSSPS